jgi:regulator of replication initiation timing
MTKQINKQSVSKMEEKIAELKQELGQIKQTFESK